MTTTAAPNVTIDAPALRTLVELLDEHSAEWVNVRGDANSLAVDLHTSNHLDETGLPVASYVVPYTGGATRMDVQS
jgi:hypothetical protein